MTAAEQRGGMVWLGLTVALSLLALDQLSKWAVLDLLDEVMQGGMQ